MQPSSQISLAIATIATVGLSAGLLFGYSISVNGGLGALDDESYLAAMQSINHKIQNPAFLLVYFIPVLLLPLCSAYAFRAMPRTGALLVVAASALYIFGVLGVTIAGNVPLNDALANVPVKTVMAQELQRQRTLFEEPWNQWHALRTMAAVLSMVLLLLAFLRYGPRAAV